MPFSPSKRRTSGESKATTSAGVKLSPGSSPDPEADTATSSEMPPLSLRMSYRIGRGEQGVLTFEPYKSALLPLWRFRTPAIARRSADDLWARFEDYGRRGDFVGMDMARKFIQMGMTRAKRYANHAGGRKYKPGTREELPKSGAHADKADKEEASRIFRAVWERCRAHEGYQEMKGEFLKEQKEWMKIKKEETEGE